MQRYKVSKDNYTKKIKSKALKFTLQFTVLGHNPERHNPETHNPEGHNPERHNPEDP